MAICNKALIDVKFESKRNADEARRAVLVKAILEAKEAAKAFTSDVADIFDTYKYIKAKDANVASKFWLDICYECNKFNIDFANAFPIESTHSCWVFRSYIADGCYLVMSRNIVALRRSPVYYEDLNVNTLSVKQAEEFFSRIMEFTEGFPKYVKHFFELVDNIEL